MPPSDTRSRTRLAQPPARGTPRPHCPCPRYVIPSLDGTAMRYRMHRHIRCDFRTRHSPQRTHPRRRTHSRHRPLEPEHDPTIAHASKASRNRTRTNSPGATAPTSELRGSALRHSARTRRLRSCNVVFASPFDLENRTRSGFSHQLSRHHRRNLEK